MMMFNKINLCLVIKPQLISGTVGIMFNKGQWGTEAVRAVRVWKQTQDVQLCFARTDNEG